MQYSGFRVLGSRVYVWASCGHTAEDLKAPSKPLDAGAAFREEGIEVMDFGQWQRTSNA